MSSLFNFGFFGNQPHRVFNYRPRYYDPEEEKRRRLFGDVDESTPGSSIRGAFRDGNYQKTRSSLGTVHGIITIITAALVVAILVYMFKFFGLL